MDLQRFCKEGSCSGLERPFSQGAFTYASDGWIAVRVPRVESAEENPKAPDMSRIPWGHEDLDDFGPLPDYDIATAKQCRHCKGSGKASTCPECGGEGEVTLDSGYNEYDVECATCHGEGTVPGRPKDEVEPCDRCKGSGHDLISPVTWGNGYISMAILERIKDLPGVKLSTHGNGLEPFRFVFDGGEGLAMPLRY